MSLDVKSKHHGVGATLSKHRLAEISHHFLSEKNERPPIWQNTFIVPVLLSSRYDDYIVYQLDRALKLQEKHTSMVLNIEAQMGSNNPLTTWKSGSTLAHTNSTDDKDEPKLPDFCLIPVTSPSTTLALQSDRLILAVHASLGGTRLAYNQLAFLASLGTNFNVCVVMFGARTPKEANRFFEFLCHNARSLLELELERGGYLLANDDLSHSGKPNSEPFVKGITEVAQGIVDCFARKKQQTKTSHTALPGSPAAYLS